MNTMLLQAEKWLNELGISTAKTPANTLAVNQRQMWEVAGAEDYVLSELKIALGYQRIFWESEGTYLGMTCLFLGAF